MTKLAETISLGPEEEASRLWVAASKAHGRADEDLVSLCECLDLGIRAAEILAIQRLLPVKHEFPGTITLQLDTPAEEVEVYRDAVTVPRTLQFTEILDLLSADDLDCVGPKLHRGWEDRRFSCRRSRGTARSATAIALGPEERERLLMLSAYRNRIFRCPPPVRIEPRAIVEAFDELARLVTRLRSDGV